MITVSDALIDPGLDLKAQSNTIAALLSELPSHKAAIPVLREWFACWQAMLTALKTEVDAGIMEGLDDDRRGFLERAERLAYAAVNLLAIARVGLGASDALAIGHIWTHHTRALWAIRGARQGLMWVVATEISGAPTRFLVQPEADALIASAMLDPLSGELDLDGLVRRLTLIARGVLWR